MVEGTAVIDRYGDIGIADYFLDDRVLKVGDEQILDVTEDIFDIGEVAIEGAAVAVGPCDDFAYRDAAARIPLV